MRYVERNEICRSLNRPSSVWQRDCLRHFVVDAGAKDSEIQIRRLRDTDKRTIRKVLEEVNTFTPEEISVAVSLIDEGMNDSPAYRFLVATEKHDEVMGYICYGQAPMTSGTWDIYWIAVCRRFQRRRIGSLLLRFAEIEIRAEGGRLIAIETSSKPSYESTRRFYEKMGYHVKARIAKFYSEEDDKLVYCKYLLP